MIRRTATIAGIAAGFALLSPVAAFATGPATGTTPNPVPTTAPSTPTTQQPPPADGEPAGLSLSTTKGAPGAKVAVRITCTGKSQLASKAAILTGKSTLVVNDVAPGTYPITLVCHAPSGATSQAAAQFTVLPKAGTAPVEKKQVVKVPKGAAQTGDGSTAPSQGTDLSQVAYGAAAAALLAGSAIVLTRRRYGARS